MDTRLFGPLGLKAHIFSEYAMGLNHHNWGVSPSKYETDEGLKNFY